MTKSVFVEKNDQLISKMFLEAGWDVLDHPEQADLICFSGGSDVSPMLYEEASLTETQCDPNRDQVCCDLFYRYEGKKPFVGICRGAQFLNVINGGSLYQHVDNHGGTHPAEDASDGKEYMVTSTHHQMMIPGEEGEIVLFGELSTSKEPPMFDENLEKDVECVYYQDTNSLCFQPHPEYTSPEQDSQKIFWDYLNQYLF